MAIFVVSALDAAPEGISAKIKENLPQAHSIEIKKGEWLVSFQGSSQDLSNLLDITNGELGTATVFAVRSYYGYAPRNIWDWLSANWDPANG